ncbi:MAG TPA: hypothetical protein ENN03_07525 [bacterium]|nr:hypothetical protein [bacterium]
MSRKCSDCGKILGFRNAFELQGMPLCRDCLAVKTGRKAPPAATDTSAQNSRDDETAKIYKQLKTGGIGSVIFGVINIVLGVITAAENPVNAVLAVFGLILLIEGIWLLVSPKPSGLIIDGLVLGMLGIWNILITIQNISAGGGTGSFLVYGIAQIFWGIQSYRRYIKLKQIAPERFKAKETEAAVRKTIDDRSFHSLFDSGLTLSNLRIALLYAGVSFLSSLLSHLLYSVSIGWFFLMPAVYYANSLLIGLVAGFLLCFLGFRISKMWLLAILFSLLYLLTRVGLFSMFSLVNPEIFSTTRMLTPSVVSSILAISFIRISSLFYVIRRWGVSLGPLVLGMTTAEICGSLFAQILQAALVREASFQLTVDFAASMILGGAILGAALYWGFSLALKRPATP